MQLLKAKYKIKCEMGACKNTATHTIKLARVGLKSQIHICSDCLQELSDLIASEIVPKSIETLNGSGGRKKRVKKEKGDE